MDGERRVAEPVARRPSPGRTRVPGPRAQTGAAPHDRHQLDRAPVVRPALPRASKARQRRRTMRTLRRALIAGTALVGLSGAVLAFGSSTVSSHISAAVNQMLIAGGLGLNVISVAGVRHTSVDEVFAALGADEALSLPAFDLAAARLRLAELPWVDTVELTKQLPDGLNVRITEKRPYAVWQHKNLLFLIDRAGKTLDPVGPSDYPDLPIVIGAGAAPRTPGLLAALAGHPNITSRLLHAQRIADRRWTLRLRRPPAGAAPLEVLLPADARAEAEALARLDALIGEDRLMERRVAAVDFRLPERTTFRLEPAPPRQSATTAAPAGKPGAATAPALLPLALAQVAASPAAASAAVPQGGAP